MDITLLYGRQLPSKLLVESLWLSVLHTQTTSLKTLPPLCQFSFHLLSQCTSSTSSSQQMYISIIFHAKSSLSSAAALCYLRHIYIPGQSQDCPRFIQG